MKATRTAPVAKLVVVIDDDPLILEATEGLLRSWGCSVVTAESCDEALVRLAETEAGRRPDLIVCDYRLSRGTDRTRRHRKAPQRVPRCVRNSSASHQRGCGLASVRGRPQGIPPFVQAGECGEVSRGAGRRLHTASARPLIALGAAAHRQLILELHFKTDGKSPWPMIRCKEKPRSQATRMRGLFDTPALSPWGAPASHCHAPTPSV